MHLRVLDFLFFLQKVTYKLMWAIFYGAVVNAFYGKFSCMGVVISEKEEKITAKKGRICHLLPHKVATKKMFACHPLPANVRQLSFFIFIEN